MNSDVKKTIREALDVASQLAEIAGDWNLDDVEINGEMVAIHEVNDVFIAALAALDEPTYSHRNGETEPLDMPDGPGWWAFEGKFTQHADNDLRHVMEVVEEGDRLLTIISYDLEPLDQFFGKWTRLTMPWEDSHE